MGKNKRKTYIEIRLKKSYNVNLYISQGPLCRIKHFSLFKILREILLYLNIKINHSCKVKSQLNVKD